LGPEDMASYITQQLRWARGCLSALPRILTARLPVRLRAQYLLSGLYWLSGWTVLVYMAFPLVRILFGVQPLAHLTAPEFLLHFAPYFAVALSTAALAGTGAYTFAALALAASTFWLHIVASMLTAAGRKGSFKVTPKQGAAGRQPRGRRRSARAERSWSGTPPPTGGCGASTKATTPSARARRTGCWWPPRSTTPGASTRSGAGRAATCAAPTGCSPRTGSAATSS